MAAAVAKCTRCSDIQKRLDSAKKTNNKFADRIVLLEHEAIQDRASFTEFINKFTASQKTQLDAINVQLATQKAAHDDQMATQKAEHDDQMAAQNVDIKHIREMLGAIILRKLIYVSRELIWTEYYQREATA